MPKLIICPYFAYEKATKIKCERCIVNCADTKERRDFERKFCGSHNWKNCANAKRLNREYELKEKRKYE